jgi:uncharacterized protein YbjT (DUF2867 family)
MTVLVIGARGQLGRPIAAELRQRGVEVRGLARRPTDGCVVGDLADPVSLAVACEGVTRMFLVSSPVREQVALETNAIEAAERAGVEHIVKISNIPIAGLETGLHGNHRAIERRLDASPIRATFVQPSFFTSVLDKQREMIERGQIVFPAGGGRIAWIDPVDIAAVAVEALVHDDLDGPLHLTGPEALEPRDVADRLGLELIEPSLTVWSEAIVAGGLDPWLAESTIHLYEAVQHGALADVTDTVPRVLGRPATPVFVPGAPL